jgi:hypothetical protein
MMHSPQDTITSVRDILKQWDDGFLSAAEFDCAIHDLGTKSLFDCIERGEEYKRFGSCCCSSHPPDRSFEMEVIIQPHGFTAKKKNGSLLSRIKGWVSK